MTNQEANEKFYDYARFSNINGMQALVDFKDANGDPLYNIDFYSGMTGSDNDSSTTGYSISDLAKLMPAEAAIIQPVFEWLFKNADSPDRYVTASTEESENYPIPAIVIDNYYNVYLKEFAPFIKRTPLFSDLYSDLVVGNTVHLDAGEFGSKVNADVNTQIQWLIDQDVLDGGEGNELLLTEQMYGRCVSARVIASANGTTFSTIGYSNTLDPVRAPNVAPTSVTISGTAKVGSTLTVAVTDDNTYPGSEILGTFTTVQWKANGAVIPGATEVTYLVTLRELGKVITCEVTIKNMDGVERTKTSAATNKVIGA